MTKQTQLRSALNLVRIKSWLGFWWLIGLTEFSHLVITRTWVNSGTRLSRLCEHILTLVQSMYGLSDPPPPPPPAANPNFANEHITQFNGYFWNKALSVVAFYTFQQNPLCPFQQICHFSNFLMFILHCVLQPSTTCGLQIYWLIIPRV